mgnify:CR=1 FL=1
MAVRVDIQGVGVVEFDDSFAKLSEKEQQDLVNQVANSRRTSGASASAAKTEGRTETDTEYLRAALQGILLGFGDEAEGLVFGV